MTQLSLRSAIEVYESGMYELRSAIDHADYYAVGEDGTRRPLPIGQWLCRAPDDEERLLDRATGPVLDIGCGPGRHLAALGRRGVNATGIEVSRVAVAIAREQGADVIHGSVFDVTVPGIWKTALLLDGNIGIGGDPERLLARACELLGNGGQVLVELEPPDFESRAVRLRLEGPSDVSDWFPWAWVGTDAISAVAEAVGLEVSDIWSTRDRWFARLHLISSA